MRRRLFLFMIGAMMVCFLLWVFGSQSGANSTSGAPTIMCMDCHVLPKGAEIKISKLPKAFQPGATYEVTLTLASAVKSEGEIQGGFAVSTSAGELIVTDARNTQKSNGYLTHTPEGALLRSWKFKWKAPMEKQKIILRVSVVAANGDFAPANDGFARREFVLLPQ